MSLQQDGNGDQIDGLAFTSYTNVTVCGWCYVDSDMGNTNQPIVGALSSVGGAPLLVNWDSFEDGFSNQMEVAMFDGVTFNSAQFASRPATGTWFFWYVRCSGTAANLLQAGWASPTADFVTAATTMTVLGGGQTANQIRFGNVNTPAYFSRMRHAYLRAWNAVLTDAEIALERNNIAAVRTANLIFDCPADHGTTALAVLDYSGNGNNLTQSGNVISTNPPLEDILNDNGDNAFIQTVAAGGKPWLYYAAQMAA